MSLCLRFRRRKVQVMLSWGLPASRQWMCSTAQTHDADDSLLGNQNVDTWFWRHAVHSLNQLISWIAGLADCVNLHTSDHWRPPYPNAVPCEQRSVPCSALVLWLHFSNRPVGPFGSVV